MPRNRHRRLSPRMNTRLSKLMALLLRHQPELAGIQLDERGATDIDAFASAVSRMPRWEFIRREHIVELVRSCPRGRFEIDEQANTVRACYGHSLPQPVRYEPAEPPEKLYHGTSPDDVESIRWGGLQPMGRQYVHLSATPRLAHEVGSRHTDSPVVTVIDAIAAHRDGIAFHRATDQIWLVKEVPGQYILEWDAQGAPPEEDAPDASEDEQPES